MQAIVDRACVPIAAYILATVGAEPAGDSISIDINAAEDLLSSRRG
jgi:hypothetical protein